MAHIYRLGAKEIISMRRPKLTVKLKVLNGVLDIASNGLERRTVRTENGSPENRLYCITNFLRRLVRA